MNRNFFYVPPKGDITLDFIRKCIERKLSSNGRMNNLENYYVGKQPIMEKVQPSASSPDNKVLTNYCKVIADFFATTLTGKPIEYDSVKPKDIEMVQEVFDDNDIESEDSELATMLNVFGVAYEQVFIDDEGHLRFTTVDPREVIIIRDRTAKATPVCVLKVWRFCEDDEFYVVERYEEGFVTTYKYYNGNQQLENVDKKAYMLDKLPFIELRANEYEQSVFEQVLTLQDAYNKLVSLQIDDYEGFVDSFLGIYNAGGTQDEDIAAMKQNRVLLLDGDSKAEWIVKNANPAVIEEIKTSLEKNIHQISLLPDFSDENFTGNSSGVAIKYKMIGANSVVAKQQRAFSECVESRLKFIISYLNAKNGASLNFADFSYTFKTLQIDEDETITDMIEKLADKIPLASLAKNLSFTTPDDIEMIKKADDKKFSQEKTSEVLPMTPEEIIAREG